MENKSSPSKWFFRPTSIFIGIILALFIGEIAIRIFASITLRTSGKVLPPMYLKDENLGWRLKPNFKGVAKTTEFSTEIKINSDGFRDYEHSSPNDQATFKILGLGDSFTFGYGVELEETYLSLLEKYLKAEIFKIGVPGYSIKEEFILFEEYGLKIQPHLVIIGFDINDHTDCLNTSPKYEIVGGYITTNHRNFLLRHSYLYSHLDMFIKTIINRKNKKEEKRKAWECAVNYLKKINEMAKADDTELLIVYIPHRSQVYPGLPQDRYIISEYFDDLDNLLESYCRENNIFYLNFLPYFIKASEKGEQLYYLATDAHWNSKGHMTAAKIIYNFLLNK